MIRLKNLLQNDSGATAVEYVLICALIVIACVGGMAVLGGGVSEHYNEIEEKI